MHTHKLGGGGGGLTPCWALRITREPRPPASAESRMSCSQSSEMGSHACSRLQKAARVERAEAKITSRALHHETGPSRQALSASRPCSFCHQRLWQIKSKKQAFDIMRGLEISSSSSSAGLCLST